MDLTIKPIDFIWFHDATAVIGFNQTKNAPWYQAHNENKQQGLANE